MLIVLIYSQWDWFNNRSHGDILKPIHTIFYSISQGSVLGSLIFSIFCATYFFDSATAGSCIDDDTHYSVNETKDIVIKQIEEFFEFLFQCIDFDCGKSHTLFQEMTL